MKKLIWIIGIIVILIILVVVIVSFMPSLKESIVPNLPSGSSFGGGG